MIYAASTLVEENSIKHMSRFRKHENFGNRWTMKSCLQIVLVQRRKPISMPVNLIYLLSAVNRHYKSLKKSKIYGGSPTIRCLSHSFFWNAEISVRGFN